MILVTGATGNVGGACARYLLERGTKNVRCLVRDPTSDKAQALAAAGATLCQGSFDDAASLDKALEGVEAALLACSNQPEQVALESNFINAASERYIVKLSTCGCAGYCDATSAIEYGRWHATIEAALEAAETVQWTVLQPNDYMQNHMGDVFGTLPHKLLAYPHTTSGARIVDTRDVGEIAAKLLLLSNRSAHHGKKYHVCGPDAVSVRSLASMYEAALQLPSGAIMCVPDMDEAACAEGLEKKAGFPRWLAVAVARNQMFWAEGKLDYESSDAVMALHPTFRNMQGWIAEHAPLVKFAE